MMEPSAIWKQSCSYCSTETTASEVSAKHRRSDLFGADQVREPDGLHTVIHSVRRRQSEITGSARYRDIVRGCQPLVGMRGLERQELGVTAERPREKNAERARASSAFD